MSEERDPAVSWRELLDKSLDIGLGAIVLTKQSLSKLVDELVSKGSLQREEAKKLVEQMLERGREGKSKVEALIADAVEKMLVRADVARRSELDALAARIERLEQQARPEQTG
jgi:polyhydroxyalkanoate synthesis regulator phasin